MPNPIKMGQYLTDRFFLKGRRFLKHSIYYKEKKNSHNTTA